MSDLFLIAPPDIEASTLIARLASQSDGAGAAALLLLRGARNEADYLDFVSAVTPMAQEANLAVLIEGAASWVKSLGADGLHVTGNIASVREAVAALKPDYIVGVGDIRSRHDAMQKAESGVDYILFGPLSGRIDDAQRELAAWWIETMEVPCVLSDPDAQTVDAGKAEFAGRGVLAMEHSA